MDDIRARIGGAARSAVPPSLSIGHNSDNIAFNPALVGLSVRLNQLQGSHKRTAHALAFEIMALAARWGIERIGFLTLTFRENLTDAREANRRLANLSRRVIKGRYSHAIAVRERQERGAIHFHLVVVLGADIRTGLDFEQIADETLAKAVRYSSANDALKAEWKFWRDTAPGYGFGRTELLPVKSNAEGIARYVGSYIGEHVRNRLMDDKGSRLVSYIGYKPGDRKASSQMFFATERGWLWRQKVGAFLSRMGYPDTDAIANVVGPKWAYVLQDEIWFTPLSRAVVYPSKEIAEVAFDIYCQGIALREEYAACHLTTGDIGTRGAEAMNLLRRHQTPKRRQPTRQPVELVATLATNLGALAS